MESKLKIIPPAKPEVEPLPMPKVPVEALKALDEAIQTAEKATGADPKFLGIKETSLVNEVIPLKRKEFDFAGLRDTLLALRDDNVYCPECRCANWLADDGGKIHHYTECRIGRYTEELLKVAPKKDATVRWKTD
jgi:hypothetical protein